MLFQDQVVMIPLDNTTLPSANSKCGNTTNDEMSILDVSMDGGKINFTFSFNSTGDDYNLHVVDFSYDPTSKYFPNHESKLSNLCYASCLCLKQIVYSFW